MNEFELISYSYHLPEELIAQEPVSPRDSSRLLVVHRKTGTWEHRKFKDLPEFLNSDDFMVVNNTQVMKARLLGHRIKDGQRGGRVEFVLLEQKGPLVWEGLFKASARYVPGLSFEIPTPDGLGLKGRLIHGSAESLTGTVVAEFDRDPLVSGAGEIPLPHYIERHADSSDESQYQTVYAKELGSAAAPTAGLHFTNELVQSLEQKGIQKGELTLHVGLGTFRPIKSSDIRQHQMHEEKFVVPDAVAEKVTAWKAQSKRILAVGTTSVRTLESAWQNGSPGYLKSGPGRTSLFIRPGAFQFQVVDRLLTNFHLPQSTLLVLVSCFAGRELILAAYQEAVKERYRFFSYGDAMLIL